MVVAATITRRGTVEKLGEGGIEVVHTHEDTNAQPASGAEALSATLLDDAKALERGSAFNV